MSDAGPVIAFHRNALQHLRSLADLFTGDRADVRNVPPHIRERFDDRDNENDEETQMHEHRNKSPEHGEKSTDARDAAENQRNDRREDVEENPDAAKNDRLHGVEAHEAIVLFQDVEDDPADQRYAGDGRGYVGWQTT